MTGTHEHLSQSHDHGEMKRGDEWNKVNLYPKSQLLDAKMKSRGKPFSKLSNLKFNEQKPLSGSGTISI